MNKCLGRAALAAMLAFGGRGADAQITTVVSTPKASVASQQQAVRREAAAQDSVARVTLTGMKQWVDSAAASLALKPDTGTAPPPENATPQRPVAPSADSATPRAAERNDQFRDGARAPNTATPVPALALTGATMIMIGLLMRRRRRVVRIRAKRR